MKKKFSAFILILFMIFAIYNTNESNINVYSDDINTPVIEKLIPHKGEQYIVSKPDIKISYSNINESKLNNLKLYINYEDVTKKSEINTKYIYYKPENRLKRGIQVARLEYYDEFNKKNIILSEWYFSVGAPLLNHYRGSFFDNTKSNSLISADELISISRFSKHINFISISENIDSKNFKNNKNLDSKKYKKLMEACDKYSVDGEFISFPGFEFSTKLKNEKDFTKINLLDCQHPFNLKDNLSLEIMYKELFNRDEDLIGQFKYNKNYNNIDFFKYSPYGDKVVSLFEVEKIKLDNNKYELNFNHYIEALNNGWHLAPLIVDDKDSFNVSCEFRNIVLCEELTKESLSDTLKNRRLYVSEDKNIKVDYFINKSPMGSIIKEPKMLKFTISAIDNDDNDKINKIQVYSNNDDLIETKYFNSNYAKLDFTLEKVKKYTFYYVVVTQSNNKKTITSPIWIE